MSGSITIPSEVQLTVLLKQGVIYRIKGNRPHPSVDGRSHHFIVLNNSPVRGDVLVLTNGTSQVARVQDLAIQRGEPSSTVVIIPAGKYSIFPEQTAINCNSVVRMEFAELVEIMDEGNLTIDSIELDQLDMVNILQGVLDSNEVDDTIKDVIRPPTSE